MIDFLAISPAMASASSTASAGFSQQIYQYLPLILIFVAFYFFLIRPQQKRSQQQRAMLSALEKGDRILTSGGLIGTIIKVVSEEEVMLEISDGVHVRVMRSMITQNLSHAGATAMSQNTSQKARSNVKSLAEAKKKNAKKTTATRRRTTEK